MDNQKLIDLDELFKSKNPGLYRWIPNFILRYLKKVIHQDRTNNFLYRHRNDDAFTFCKGVVEEIGVTFDIHHIENVPKSGGCILACNHPLGALEAMCLVTELYPLRQDIRFIVNDLLLNLQSLREVMVGVNKHGRVSTESLKMVNELFSSDQLIVLFPAGLVSRKQKGIITDLKWKKTFITRAKKFQRPVIPVYIHARNSHFFYNLANIRKRLGITANIEMLYLVDEMYRQKGNHLSIVFGNLIEPATFTDSKTDDEWALYVRRKLYALREHIK